jgi:hypothetical protein
MARSLTAEISPSTKPSLGAVAVAAAAAGREAGVIVLVAGAVVAMEVAEIVTGITIVAAAAVEGAAMVVVAMAEVAAVEVLALGTGETVTSRATDCMRGG